MWQTLLEAIYFNLLHVPKCAFNLIQSLAFIHLISNNSHSWILSSQHPYVSQLLFCTFLGFIPIRIAVYCTIFEYKMYKGFINKFMSYTCEVFITRCNELDTLPTIQFTCFSHFFYCSKTFLDTVESPNSYYLHLILRALLFEHTILNKLSFLT